MLKSIFVFTILCLSLTSALRYHPHYVIQHDSKSSNILTQLRSRASKTSLPNSFTINAEPPSVLDDDEDASPEAADKTKEQTTPGSKESSTKEPASEKDEQTKNPSPSNEEEEAQSEENQEQEEASTPKEAEPTEETPETETEAEPEESQVPEEVVISTEETIENSESPVPEEQTGSTPIVVVADEEDEEEVTETETTEINEETSSETDTGIIAPVESDIVEEEEVILIPAEEEAEPVVPQTVSRASTDEMPILPTVKETYQEIDNEQVKAVSIDCTKSKDKFSKTACGLCNTNVAYKLNEDNWYIIGLAHNYKTELSKLLTNVKAAIPNTSWLAAFGENTICIVSNQDVTMPDIETPLRLMAKSRLTDYIKTSIFPVTKSTTLHMSAFVYDPIDQHGTTDKFILEYQIDNQIPVILATSLHFTTSYIDSINGKVFYQGTMELQNNHEQISIPFILNAGEEADLYELTSVLSSDLLSTQDIVKGIGITTTSAQSQFFKNIAMTNGLNQIESFQVDSVIVTIQSSIQKSTHLAITFEKTPDFALTPEYQLTDAAGAIHMNISEDGEGLTSSLKIEGVASYDVDEKKNTLKALLTKDQTKETIILLQDLQYPEITLSDLETQFRSKDSEFEGFLPDFENLGDDIKNSPLSNLTVQINRNPAPSYLIKSIVGDFQLNALLTFLGGNINIKSTIIAPNTGLSLLQSKDSEPLLFEPFVSSISLQITHTSHNLDTQEYAPSLANLYIGERYWTRGTTVNYQFDLLDCQTTAFCQAMTHLMPQEDKKITLSGPVVHGRLRLSSNPSNPDQVTTVQNIDFKNVSLHVDIAPDDTSVYLSFQNSLPINSNNEKLELNGNITFDATQGYFTSRTNSQWSNALNLGFLEINRLEITGTISSDSFAIKDPSASGIMMWGKTCFLLSKDQQKNLQFVKERCFYGIGDLKLNLDNLTQSEASGVYSGLTPYILLTSLLQYDDPFIFQKVSKQFLDIRFINYAEVSYIPKKESEPTPTLVQVLDNSGDVPGISVKGPSKLMGLTGVTKILINLETKQLIAVFTFGTEKFANGNILLAEELSKGSNSVIFKVSETYYTDDENSQATLSGKMSMLGHDGTISFKFTNQDTSFDSVISSEVFESIQVSGLSYDVKDLRKSKFSLNGNITDDLTQFNADLGGLLKEWAGGINQIVAEKDQHLEKLQNELEIKRTESCAENSCQLITQCETDPVYKCLQYKKHQVCKVKENYCLNSNMSCRKKESICVHQVETCIRDEVTTADGECLSTRNECKAFSETCQDWEYSCVGDSVRTCEEFEIVDDESTCLKYGWDCNEVEIPDPQCQADCDLKNKEYVKLNEILTSLQTKYFGLKADQAKLLSFVTLQNSQEIPFTIDTLKFTAETDKPLSTEELNWTITYTYLGKQLTVDIVGLSLVDHSEALNQVYNSITQQLAEENGFEWRTVQEFAEYINKGLELNNETRIFFLQLLDISF